MSDVTSSDSAYDRGEAFTRLVNEYQRAVLRMCYLLLRDKTLAEDATQETFLKIYRNMGAFRGECSEKTWIMKVATRTCIDMNRSGWSRFFNRRVTPDMLPESGEAYTPHDEALTAAVAKLPERLREVVLLYYYQDMNVMECAQALNISQSSVSGRLKRARAKLKGILEGSEDDG